MASLFHTPIQTLKGVGEKRAPLFGKIGAPTVGALLRLYPRAYEDWSHPFPIAMAPMQVPCPIRATVVSPAQGNPYPQGDASDENRGIRRGARYGGNLF